LMGERTPHSDPNAKGMFFGLTLRHRKQHLVRAIMEGVAYGMRDSLEIIRSLGVEIQQIRASGGGARSSLWRQIQSDIYGTELVTINVDEGPAFGAALLAGVGSKIYRSVEEACQKTIRIVSRTLPKRERVELYDKYYGVYKALYPTLKGMFDKTSKITLEKQ